MNSNIEVLLHDVKSGNPLSFDAIYRLYTPLIESTVLYLRKYFGIAESETDDLKQEALIALYNAALAYEPNKNVTFGAFAKACISNRVKSYHRRNSHISDIHDVPQSLTEFEDTLPEVDFETPEQLIINKESLCNLNKRIDGVLTPFERSVFALYITDMSYADMSETLSKPVKSIDNAIHRIKAKLRKIL